MIEVSVITPTYNRQDSLRRLLDSLAIQTLEPNKYEVIVVDDGSSSGSIDENFEGYLFQFQYLRQENQGATIARNNGALKSQGQVLVFIDDDVTISANVLETLTKVCTMDPKVIALGWLDTCNTKSESPFTKVAVSLDNKDLNRFKVKEGQIGMMLTWDTGRTWRDINSSELARQKESIGIIHSQIWIVQVKGGFEQVNLQFSYSRNILNCNLRSGCMRIRHQ